MVKIQRSLILRLACRAPKPGEIREMDQRGGFREMLQTIEDGSVDKYEWV